ncbi:MAG: bi-domain-containing oxidoreductase [Methanoregulaceae archaeon]|nr:bi-domain-containing oxidoreductase [Methanoregulaceae archaeon]
MKQILQNLGTGETLLAEVPAPGVSSGQLLVQTRATLVSLGTERMLIDFGKSNVFQKAKAQPDKVKQVLQKIKTDGLFQTLDAVKSKLDQPLGLGYCHAGVVIGVGKGVEGFEVGDWVATNGQHAEVVSIAQNLCAKIPKGVSFEEAAFTPLAAIALQGIRLINPTLGEGVVVTGLGLIGLMTVQMLRAAGCRVLGIDFDSTKCEMARGMGAETVDLSKGEDPEQAALAFSRGRGVDAVIITASTKSNEPVTQAAHMCRKRGRIVLVGVVGLELSRADFFEKELTFQVSCSYGPGRYEDNYEGKGMDYPVGFVRWTEQRNFEACLDLMANGGLDVKPLISHRYEIDHALEGYAKISDRGALGIVLQYPEAPVDVKPERTVALPKPAPASVPQAVVAVIGAGNFAGATLLPAMAGAGARLKTIVSKGGVTGTHLGKKFGFENSTTDLDSVFNDPEINTLIITTQHNTHARMVIDGLKAGKRVFVEKPLCLTEEELDQIKDVYEAQTSPMLMVGFNRRFAPHIQKMKEMLDSVRAPKAFIMTVNAGALPANHWTQDPERGGGRMIGEGCHFVDLIRFLAGSSIVDVQASGIDQGAQREDENMSVTLKFADGSIGTVHYFANGDKSFPKERLEVFAAGRILQLDNFRKMTGFGWPGFNGMALRQQDKGHANELAAFIRAVKNGSGSPIPYDELIEVTEATFKAVRGEAV